MTLFERFKLMMDTDGNASAVRLLCEEVEAVSERLDALTHDRVVPLERAADRE